MKKVLKAIAKSVLPSAIFMELNIRRSLRTPSDPEIGLLRFLARNGNFIDIGANVGGWSMPAAKLFKEVHAFEPVTSHANALRRVLPANVTVYPVALSDHDGVGQLSIPVVSGDELITRSSLNSNANVGLNQIVRKVEIRTLDSYNLRNIDVIKIDVEGHELSVLNGAAISIERERPSLIVEIEERHHPDESDAIIQSILSRGYCCYFILKGETHEYQCGLIKNIQPIIKSGSAATEHNIYVNNFVFVPLENKTLVRVIAGFRQ